MPRFDSGGNRALGYVDFPNKTAIRAARAWTAG